jgi:hypothetical protein
VKWIIHQVFHISLLEPFVQGNIAVTLESVLDAADPIEVNDEYPVEEVISSMESQCKVTYSVKLRRLPVKKNWTREAYKSFYSLGAIKQLKKFQSKNPEALMNRAFKFQK